MATRGSAFRAEGNRALRTLCAHCGTSIPTEVGHAHPLDEALTRNVGARRPHRWATERVPHVYRLLRRRMATTRIRAAEQLN